MPAITTRATNVARTSTSAPKVPMVSIVAYDTPALAVSSNVSYSRTSSTIRVAVDPAYIEIKNYSPKAKLQLINPTKKPDATFQADAVEIAVDHVIPNADGTWTAIAKLDSAEMLASGMCPGDLVRMRQVAANGVASKESALIYVDPNLNNLPNPQAVAQELHRDTFSSKPTTSVSRRAAGRRAVDVTTTTTTRRQTDIVGFRAHTIRFDVATRNGTLPPSDFKDVAQDAAFYTTLTVVVTPTVSLTMTESLARARRNTLRKPSTRASPFSSTNE